MTSREKDIAMGQIMDRREAILPTPGVVHLLKKESQKVVRHHQAKIIKQKGLSFRIKKRLSTERLVGASPVVKKAT